MLKNMFLLAIAGVTFNSASGSMVVNNMASEVLSDAISKYAVMSVDSVSVGDWYFNQEAVAAKSVFMSDETIVLLVNSFGVAPAEIELYGILQVGGGLWQLSGLTDKSSGYKSYGRVWNMNFENMADYDVNKFVFGHETPPVIYGL